MAPSLVKQFTATLEKSPNIANKPGDRVTVVLHERLVREGT